MSKKNFAMRSVAAIQNGTVIDHIDPKNTMKVLRLLKVQDEFVLIGNNLQSEKIGKKGLIKVANTKVSKEALSTIALLAPNATASVIEDYEVTEKIQLKVPESLTGIVKCPNPACITTGEPIPTRFYVKGSENIKLKCHHCERSFDSNEVELI